MRLRNIPGAREEIEVSPYAVLDPFAWKGRWQECFQNGNPLRLEIGMGKGRFLMEMAQKHREINFIGIEMYSSVLLRALQRRERLEEELKAKGEPGLSNLMFLRMDARDLPDAFAYGETQLIYLNFSDPWPKARHTDRRLTSQRFLARYEKILPPTGRIEFKTDNRTLFAFSLEEIRSAGWRLEAETWDLHADPVLCQENVMTEYEEKFSSLGNPICKLIASPKERETA